MKMHELQQSPEAASWIASGVATITSLFWKFAPGPLGALVMVIFDNPKTKQELFWRLVVAYIVTVLFGDVVFDFLRSTSWFAFLDATKKSHTGSVDFLVGGAGWSFLAGVAVMLRKFRAEPVATIEEARKAIP